MSNSLYQMSVSIFVLQDKFCKIDLVDRKIVPFVNILDKGYQLALVAWREGRQAICQPVFAQSNQRFSGEENIFLALVAMDCSGIKRVVNACKCVGFIRCRLTPRGNPTRLADAWLAW